MKLSDTKTKTLNYVFLACFLFPSSALFGAEEESPEEDVPEAEEAIEKESDVILVIEPKKKIDPERAGVEILKYLELGRSLWEGGDHIMAEKYFAAALGVPIEADEKEQVLFEMGEMYRDSGMLPKAAAAFERLIQEFGQSGQLPSVFMELGYLYRKMGGLEVAINNFYMVLNSTLNISIDQVEEARALVMKLMMLDHENERLLLKTTLPPKMKQAFGKAAAGQVAKTYSKYGNKSG